MTESSYFTLPNRLLEVDGHIQNNHDEIKIFQRRLVELVHASTCNMLLYACSLTYCSYTKAFMNHMAVCTLEMECPQHCYRSQSLFNHWKKCSRDTCYLCSNVRKTLTDYECSFRSSSRYYEALKNPNVYQLRPNDEIVDLSFDDPLPGYSSNECLQPFEMSLISITPPPPLPPPEETPTIALQPAQNNYMLDRYLFPEKYVPVNLSSSAQSSSNTNNILSPVSLTSNVHRRSDQPARYCRRCANHGVKEKYKGHTFCDYKLCICRKCTQLRKSNHPYKQISIVAAVPEVSTEVVVDYEPKKIKSLEVTVHHEGAADWTQYTNDLSKDVIVEGGKSIHGEVSYVGRGHFNGYTLPVSITPSKLPGSIAIFRTTFGGIVHYLTECEALIVGDFEWKNVEKGDIPSNAVFVGVVDSPENMQFIGRAKFNLSLVIGRVSKESGCLYIPHGHTAVMIQKYEILVDKSTSIENFKEKTPPPKEIGQQSTVTSKTQKNECLICFATPIAGVFSECMHACLCIDCIDVMNSKREPNGQIRCILCRAYNREAKRIFLS